MMVKCDIVLPLLPYSFNAPVGVELAESAPGGGRRQWHCACAPQCMFLCV